MAQNRCKGGKNSENIDLVKNNERLLFFICFSWFLEGQRHQNSWKFVKFLKDRFGIQLFTENEQNFRRNLKIKQKRRPKDAQGAAKGG